MGPPAVVLQDGARPSQVPWDDIAAVFVGGTTEWKLSLNACRLMTEAKDRGLWVHVGRVNSLRRLDFARAHGADSADGTKYARFTDAHLGRALLHLASPPPAALDL